MSKKNIILLLSICFIFFPLLALGQYITPEDGNQTIKYLKGDGDFESWFMEAFTNLDTFIEEYARQATILGKAIGGLGMMIYLSVIGYKMQSGDAEWSIEPMLKPIIIGLILINWIPFTKMIQYPFLQLSQPSKEIFKEIEEETSSFRSLRFTKQMQVLDATIKMNAELRAKKEGFWSKVGNGEIGEALGDQWDKLTAPIEEGIERLNYKLQKALGDAIETLCLLALRVCVYFIFFIQKVWAYILIVLGPISIGISLVPGFESSFYNWISKFININLYTFIAYTIINIGQQIIMAGYQMDINRLSAIVDSRGFVINESLLVNYTTYNGMLNSVIFPCVGYLVTAIGTLMTPTIADAIVSAGGAGIMTKMKANAGKAAQAGKSAFNIGRAGKAMGQKAFNFMKNKFQK